MFDEDINKKMEDRVRSIFPNPELAAQVVDLCVHKRPRGWSRKSQAPYYKEIYAKQIKQDIDKMIESGLPICWRYSVWCTEASGVTQATLYTRINQSIRYLVEQMDSLEHKYKQWQEMTRLSRSGGLGGGVVIEYIPGLREGAISNIHAETVLPIEQIPLWKRRLDDWIEDDRQTTPFVQEGLLLDEKQIFQLKIELSQLSSIQFSVKSDSVKVLKTA